MCTRDRSRMMLDLLAVLPVEAEAEDVPEEAAPHDN